MKFSIIIPLYNRPTEIDELLDSLTRQTFKDFDVIVVEDGRRYIGKTITAVVTSVLQTAAGRMIFAKTKKGGE